LNPREIFLPLAYIDKEMSQIPFVLFGNFNTRWNFFSAHFRQKDNVARKRALVETT
jgi:hypothetical protein